MTSIDKITAAKLKHARELELLEAEGQFEGLQGFKHICNHKRPFAVFEVNSLKDAADILATLKPTNETNKLGFAGKDDIVIDTPYHVTFDSPARQTRFSQPAVKLKWQYGELDIWLEFPSELVKELRVGGRRAVTDSERHYFTGMSYKQLQRIEILTYWLKSGQSQSYYGGNKVATCPKAVQALLDYIKTADNQDES